METVKFSVKKLVGKGYSHGWYKNCKCRYRVFKGARNTKKSYVMIGIEVLCKIFSNPLRNILILRDTNTSNRFSTFSTIKLLIRQYQCESYFKINETTMIITYKPTGQLIIFGGMNDAGKYLSMRMENGFLTDVYVEEAFDIKSYEDFTKLDGTIRGALPEGTFYQITLCLNGYNKEHWIYHTFFEGRMEDDFDYLMTHDYMDYCNEKEIISGGFGLGVYLHTSTYKINEFRTAEWDYAMQEMSKTAPDLFRVLGLGMWGNDSEGAYPEFNDSLIITPQEATNMSYACYSIGIDTGLSDGNGKVRKGEDVEVRSATTMELQALTSDYETLVAVDEYFHSNEQVLVKKTEPEIMNEIIDKLIEWRVLYANNPVLMKGLTCVYVDNADKGFREGLTLVARNKGLLDVRFLPCTKSRIVSRVLFQRVLMGYGSYKFSSKCPNLIREYRNIRKGEDGSPRQDGNDHCINGAEYGHQPFINRLKKWKTFKME